MLQQVKEFERHLISEEKSKATVDRFTHTKHSANETRSTLDVGIYPIECTANNVDYVFDIVNNVIND